MTNCVDQRWLLICQIGYQYAFATNSVFGILYPFCDDGWVVHQVCAELAVDRRQRAAVSRTSRPQASSLLVPRSPGVYRSVAGSWHGTRVPSLQAVADEGVWSLLDPPLILALLATLMLPIILKLVPSKLSRRARRIRNHLQRPTQRPSGGQDLDRDVRGSNHT